MQKFKHALLLTSLACVWLNANACDVQKDITVNDPIVLAGPPGQANTAGYATIHNASDKPCEIIGATSSIAAEVQLHTIEKVQDRYKMVQVNTFAVPAQGDLVLAPGSNHFMFMGLKQALKPKETVEVTLKFKDGAEKKVMATVQDMRQAIKDHATH